MSLCKFRRRRERRERERLFYLECARRYAEERARILDVYRSLDEYVEPNADVEERLQPGLPVEGAELPVEGAGLPVEGSELPVEGAIEGALQVIRETGVPEAVQSPVVLDTMQ